jgi:hypothetical protein
VELCRKVVRLQALHRALPQQLTVGHEAERRICSKREIETEELYEIKGARQPSHGSGRSPHDQ